MHGELRIAASASFGTRCLGPLLMPFLARHPRLEVTIHLDDRVFDQTGDGYDLAVRMGRPRSVSLVARKIGLSRRLVCCSPDYARRAGLPATLDDIARHACIGYSNMPPGLVWQFEPSGRGGRRRTVAVRNRLVTNNTEIARDAAIAGVGLAILPLFVAADALRDGLLIDALPSVHPVPDTIHIIRPPSRHVSRKVRAVSDYLAHELGGTPPWESVRLRADGSRPTAESPAPLAAAGASR
jgi:DNA-binding transcriptional LysR family regulator